MINAFLDLEAICHERNVILDEDRKGLLISLNPDLISDFGHYLNYERRIREECQAVGIKYVCFANRKVVVNDTCIVPVFENSSGHYSLCRESVCNDEKQIVQEFFNTVIAGFRHIDDYDTYDDIWLFLYCGSSRLASKLCELSWSSRVRLTINAFWDFLAPHDEGEHLSQIPFQRSIRLLTMSDLHRIRILETTGLNFDAIPNPSPLVGDVQAYKEICAQHLRPSLDAITKVLIPGIMTMGKGKETTLTLFNYLRDHVVYRATFVFRDRLGVICGSIPSNVSIINGDLTDEAIINLYQTAHIAILPYESETFSVRTSGALVDCLVFGVVPLVMDGTWLAHVCETLNVGYVLEDMSPETIMNAVKKIVKNLKVEQERVFRAAGLYLASNSWGQLLSLVIDEMYTDSHIPKLDIVRTSPSLFSSANCLLREGLYKEAALRYYWLSTMLDLNIYQVNLDFCKLKSGKSIVELLQDTR